ncbi:hypothetical protein LQW54_008312 [Pestalotiopsis sp. IQ-011]
MVNISDIRTYNQSQYIRYSQLQPDPTLTVPGRHQHVLEDLVRELRNQNGKGTYVSVWTGDLTLLSKTEKAASSIVAQESSIDLLFLSAGYLCLGARDESVEGIDKVTCIRHSGRVLLTLRLIPLLERAPTPRVVSILAGGVEGAISPDDLAMKSPGNHSFAKASGVAATFVTLSMEQLQKQHESIAFVHVFPGLVRTNILNTKHFGPAFRFLVGWIIMPTLGRLVFMSAAEAGQRALYAAFNPAFAVGAAAKGSKGTTGSGVYTLNEKREAVQNTKVLEPSRKQGLRDKGSDCGVGLEISRQLLDLGISTLVLAVRDEGKGRAAARELVADRANVTPETVEVWKLDLSVYESVVSFAERARNELVRLDIGVLNAGMLPLKRTVNAWTGHDEIIQVNYIPTALLAFLLLPVAKKVQQNQPRPTRITLTLSEVACWARFPVGKDVPILAALDAPGTLSDDTADRMFMFKLLDHYFVHALTKKRVRLP